MPAGVERDPEIRFGLHEEELRIGDCGLRNGRPQTSPVGAVGVDGEKAATIALGAVGAEAEAAATTADGAVGVVGEWAGKEAAGGVGEGASAPPENVRVSVVMGPVPLLTSESTTAFAAASA